jgi:hypothetical protein
MTENTPGVSRYLNLTVWDVLGISASTVCAVHCIVTPLLLGLLPAFAAYLPGDESVHSILACGVAAFGTLALVTGFRRHRRAAVLLLMFAGLAVIFFVSFFADVFPSCEWEAPLMVVGSALMIAAHYRNGSFCLACGSCDAHGKEGRHGV